MDIERAERELQSADRLTPGLWVAHSRYTAVNARMIAEQCGLDGDHAYVFGLLHDIGRRKGSWDSAHIFDGYEYMTELGEPRIARICLTHSFPVIADFDSYFERINCTEDRREFLRKYFAGIAYDDYDRLIQLCDAISLPTGACIMEKRLIDVALRHGVNNFTLERWKSFMSLKNRFDELCGCNIYSFLPDVAKNSMENL